MVGREFEIDILQGVLKTTNSEMIAIIGRRRVGKTYLIKNIYEKHIKFYLTGTQDAPIEEQLLNFSLKLKECSGSKKKIKIPINWTEAFHQLKFYLNQHKSVQKKVIFFDELPWLTSRKSGFLQAFSYFWNDWASTANIIVVICGSVASWMIENVVNNKGGLHNRITKLINLEPFTLKETELFLKSKHINLDKYQIAQLYMAMGGIPHYLNEVRVGETASQTINRSCFTKNGLLHNEFNNLYAALFENYHNHVAIITALSSKWKGLTRNEIINLTKFTNGGGLSKLLHELVQSSFISAYEPFGKVKRETLYRLTDEYSLFYLQFIKNSLAKKNNSWIQHTNTPKYKAWSGFAFESLCLKHISQLKIALGIGGIYTQQSSYVIKGTALKQGAQIDLLIDRADKAINMCEMKYVTNDFSITKEYAKNLRQKRELFKEKTGIKKLVFTTLITTYSLQHNEHSLGLIDNVVLLHELYK